MGYTIKGKVLAIMPTKSTTTKEGKILSTREIVIKTYRFNPETGERELSTWNTPKFEARDEICNQMNSLQVGSDVDIQFSVSGVSYTDKTDGSTKYFTTLRIVRIVAEQLQVPTSTPQQPVQIPQYQTQFTRSLQPDAGQQNELVF